MNAVQQDLTPDTLGEAEPEKVREQLNRLLDTHHFKNSRRYPALLRFVVEETLEGRGEYLKERLLGIRVFDRPADYDTATDPIVRVTIAEIRKRIAQYYHDEEHDAELRIELLPGHYMPEFRASRGTVADRAAVVAKSHLPSPAVGHAVTVVEMPLHEMSVVTDSEPRTKRQWRRWIRPAGIALAVTLALASFAAERWLRPTAIDQFWAPILQSRHTVLLCLPADAGKNIKQGSPSVVGPPSSASKTVNPVNAPEYTFLGYESLAENVVYSDMLAALDISGVLTTHHRDYRVRSKSSTTLEDLHDGPSVLIGGLDNQWTMRALAGLRYHFAGSDADRYWIADSTKPGNRDWALDLKQPYAAVMRDYAIIASLHNEETSQPEIIVAGIGMSGTAAAGEFIANESRLEEVRRQIGPRFKYGNFEIVIAADVVNGIAGAPKVLAIYVW